MEPGCPKLEGRYDSLQAHVKTVTETVNNVKTNNLFNAAASLHSAPTTTNSLSPMFAELVQQVADLQTDVSNLKSRPHAPVSSQAVSNWEPSYDDLKEESRQVKRRLQTAENQLKEHKQAAQSILSLIDDLTTRLTNLENERRTAGPDNFETRWTEIMTSQANLTRDLESTKCDLANLTDECRAETERLDTVVAMAGSTSALIDRVKSLEKDSEDHEAGLASALRCTTLPVNSVPPRVGNSPNPEMG